MTDGTNIVQVLDKMAIDPVISEFLRLGKTAVLRHFKQGEWFELRSKTHPDEKSILEVTVEILSEDTIRKIFNRTGSIELTVDELEVEGFAIQVFTEVVEL